MARFCTKCGNPLNEDGKCTCQQAVSSQDTISKFKNFFTRLLTRTGIGDDAHSSGNPFETDKNIVPDVIRANDGEVPIKQYEAATLRSRIRGQHAKGKLQVTNKRLLFRASGASYKGRITLQHEFALEEIAGIEIKKINRISPLNILICFNLISLMAPFALFFDNFSTKTPGFALFVSIIAAVAFAIPFFVLKKKFWLKLLLLNCGIGCLYGTSNLSDLSASTIFFGIKTNIADIIGVAFFILWLLNMILVCLVPDLTLCIKTKGASEAITIKRKQFATLFKQEQEHTGFSEVLPGKDIDIMINELGALINDIQTFGDTAIDNWKEV